MNENDLRKHSKKWDFNIVICNTGVLGREMFDESKLRDFLHGSEAFSLQVSFEFILLTCNVKCSFNMGWKSLHTYIRL